MRKQDTPIKIVVAEDDGTILHLLGDKLEADGFDVLLAPTAADALRLCQNNDPDVLLLDLTLPNPAISLDVLDQLARREIEVKTILLSGRGTERARVEGLDSMGADDYVVKPYTYSELHARIGRLLKERAKVDKPEGLTPKESALMDLLGEVPTRVYSMEELVRGVFGVRDIHREGVENLHRVAKSLKGKLDDGRVVNCWGVGYRLEVNS